MARPRETVAHRRLRTFAADPSAAGGRRDWRAGALSVAVLAVVGSVVLTGCGSSSGPGGGNTAAATPPSTAVTGSASGSASTATTPAAGGSSASAADTAAIKTAYAKFFSPNTPGNVSLGLLQNGPAFKAAIDQQASGSMASEASAKVSTVQLLSPDTAEVRFTIYLNKQPMLKDQKGYAVREGGTWKVAEYTFCGLLTLEGTAPAACKQPAATEVPK